MQNTDVVALIAGMLWAGRTGGVPQTASEQDFDKVANRAWDIYYSAQRTAAEAGTRFSDHMRAQMGRDASDW